MVEFLEKHLPPTFYKAIPDNNASFPIADRLHTHTQISLHCFFPFLVIRRITLLWDMGSSADSRHIPCLLIFLVVVEHDDNTAQVHASSTHCSFYTIVAHVVKHVQITFMPQSLTTVVV